VIVTVADTGEVEEVVTAAETVAVPATVNDPGPATDNASATGNVPTTVPAVLKEPVKARPAATVAVKGCEVTGVEDIVSARPVAPVGPEVSVTAALAAEAEAA